MNAQLTLYSYRCRVCGHPHERLVGSIIKVSKKLGFRYDVDRVFGDAFVEVAIEKSFHFEIQPSGSSFEKPQRTTPVACPSCGVMFLNSSFIEEQLKYPVSLSELPNWWVGDFIKSDEKEARFVRYGVAARPPLFVLSLNFIGRS